MIFFSHNSYQNLKIFKNFDLQNQEKKNRFKRKQKAAIFPSGNYKKINNISLSHMKNIFMRTENPTVTEM